MKYFPKYFATGLQGIGIMLGNFLLAVALICSVGLGIAVGTQIGARSERKKLTDALAGSAAEEIVGKYDVNTLREKCSQMIEAAQSIYEISDWAIKRSAGREGPPGKPEGAKCRHCGESVSTNDIYNGRCPNCRKTP